jgi:hypothetical protein
MEFVSEIIYSSDKVTPVNIGLIKDQEANESKLFQSEQARGIKIHRTAKRVSGQLLTLIIFEVGVVKLHSEPLLLKNMDDGKSTLSGSYTDLTLGGFSGSVEGGIAGVQSVGGEGEGDKEDESREGDEGGGHKERERKRNDEEGKSETMPQGGIGNNGDKQENNDIIQKLSLPIDIPSVPIYLVPLFRVVAYDPKARRKLNITVPPEALLELAGGVHSQYLMPERRKELASILCDSLLCIFPRGLPYEIIIPWSGADPHMMATASAGMYCIRF